MSEYNLTATSALGLSKVRIAETELSEVSGLSLVSIATPKDGEKALTSAVQSKLKTKMPAIGTSEISADGGCRLLGLQADQIFAQIKGDDPQIPMQITAQLDGVGYCTDQSDSWVTLRINGAHACRALGRICMLNIHTDAFAQGAVARTSMEHIGVILHRESADGYQLMAMRSFGQSLWHALETSLRNL